MRFSTFRNYGIIGCVLFALTLGWCTCRSGSSDKKNTSAPAVTYVPVQPAAPVQQYQNPNTFPAAQPVYAPTPQPVPVQQQAMVNVDSLRVQAQAWLAGNPRLPREMRRPTVIAGVRATAIRFPAANARQFTNNEADWNQLRFDFNGDGIDEEKWLIKFGQITKREQLGPDGKTVVGDPIYFN